MEIVTFFEFVGALRPTFQRMSGKSNYSPSGEWESSSFLRKWTFSAANEMLNRGQKQTLQFEDMMNIPSSTQSAKLLKSLKRCYRTSTACCFLPRLMIALLKMASFQVIIVIVFTLAESATRVSLPVVLIYLLSSLQEDEGNASYKWAAILGSISIIQCITHHVLFYFTMKIGWTWKNACTAFIHDRLFYLDGGKLQSSNTSTGMLVNLISNDVARFEEFSVVSSFPCSYHLHGLLMFFLVCLLYLGISS